MNKTTKKLRIFLLLAAVCIFLSSCSNQISNISSEPSLPPVISSLAVPQPEDVNGYVVGLNIFLPTANSQSLESLKVNLAIANEEHPAQAAIKKLLSYSGNEKFQPLLEKSQIGLLNSIEISSETASVNLSANVHQLSPDEQIKVCRAITNTLCQFSDISYVNILCNNKPIGIKRENSISIDGLFQFQSATGALNPGSSRLISLYIPNKSIDGLTIAVKAIKLTNDDKKQLSIQILDELSAQLNETGFNGIPSLNSLLARDITISEPIIGKGLVVNIDFSENSIGVLSKLGLTKEKLVPSICMTLTSLIPDLYGVKINFGREQIAKLNLENPTSLKMQEISFENGIISRKYFFDFILSNIDLYIPNNEDGLAKELKLLPHMQLRNPSFIMNEVLRYANENSKKSAIKNIFQKNNILAFSRKEDTLLINLSNDFLNSLEKLDAKEEKQIVYSLVNSFCSINGIKRIRFFADGKPINSYKGNIFMNGEFLFNPEI